MQLALFSIFSLLMLAFALGVILLRNPVSCAMCLVMSFVALAAVFVTLDAYFIAVVQVLVYAGAVMVLFLFIIMLLDLREEKRRRVRLSAWVGGGTTRHDNLMTSLFKQVDIGGDAGPRSLRGRVGLVAIGWAVVAKRREWRWDRRKRIGFVIESCHQDFHGWLAHASMACINTLQPASRCSDFASSISL